MKNLKISAAILAAAGGMLLPAGCGDMGKVEQGRVIAYDAAARQVTLIPDPGVLPPVTVAVPADPEEMGPAPAAGGLMRLDVKNHRMVIYDRAAQQLRTVDYTPVAEQHDVAKGPAAPAIDRAKRTITIYAAREHVLITFTASDDLLAMPASTWRAGDVVRYYYKDPAQALRLMNVTQTDLSKQKG
ncbi:MAG TPA: DUF4881 domain-containing protein [Bryobacteraceae bacterium]|nr:DUF4881 domain-containing protein [Bryobacteraceae bacterium]